MVQCYKIVLDYDLETLDSCSDQILTKLDNISIPSCSRDCRVQSNLNMIPTTFIYLSNASEGIMYQGSFNPLENYSFLGIDFLYYSNGPIRISINDIELANDFSKQYSQFEQPINGYDCSGQIFLTYQSIKIDYPNQQNNFQVKMWGDNSNQELRLRSIKVWTNCMDNCLNCDSSNSCSKCVEGFNLKVIKGKGMCETRNGCSTISSCYKCYPNQNGCSQCNPGYQLNKKGQCDDLNVLQVPCTTNQYFDSDSNQCLSYSQECFIISNSSAYINNCSNISNLQSYKCSETQNVIIYRQEGYGVIKCGCAVQNCISCKNSNICNQCNSGFTLDQIKNICKPNCSSNQYYDSQSNLCINCGQNCNTCNIFECTKCQYKYQQLESNKRNCIQCNLSNCLECSKSNVCSLCDSGYTLNFSLNYCVSNQCNVSNCQKCNPYNNNQCDQCEVNYQLSQNSLQCTICNVSNCKQCYSGSQNQCKVCNSGYYSDLQKQCAYISTGGMQEQLTVQHKLNSNGYTININSNKNFNYLPDDATNLLYISISNISIKSQTVDLNSDKIIINVILDQNVKDQTLNIIFKDQLFIQANQILQSNYKQNLTPYLVLSSDQQEQLQQLKGVSTGVSQSMVAGFVPAVFFGNFYVIINMIDMTGYLYYLLYVNIRLPQNVLEFYAIFKDFQFPFIPNLFQNILPADYIQESPKKFMEMNADCYFIKNAGQSITIIIAIVTIYVIIKGMSNAKIKHLQPYLKDILGNTWEFGAFFDMLGVVYLYVLVSSLLQFYQFDNGDKNTYLLNYILHSVFTIISITIPFVLVYLLFKQKNIKEDSIMQKKLSSLISGLKLFNQSHNNIKTSTQIHSDINLIQNRNPKTPTQTTEIMDKVGSMKYDQSLNAFTLSSNSIYKITRNKKNLRKTFIEKYSKYLNSFQYIRKLVFCILIVYFHDHTMIQLVLLQILPIWSAFYYFYITPHEKNSENVKNGVCELFLFAIQLTFFTLVKDEEDQDESDRMNIGWVIIAFSLVILLWNFIGMVLDMLYQFYKFLKRVCIGLKIIKNPQIKPENTNPSQILKEKRKQTIIKESAKQNEEEKDQNNKQVGESKQTIQIQMTHNLIIPSLANYSQKSNTKQQQQQQQYSNIIEFHNNSENKNEQIGSNNICSIDPNHSIQKQMQEKNSPASFSNPSNFFQKEEQYQNNIEFHKIEIKSIQNAQQINTDPSLSINQLDQLSDEKEHKKENKENKNAIQQTTTENNILHTNGNTETVFDQDHFITFESNPSFPFFKETQLEIESQFNCNQNISNEKTPQSTNQMKGPNQQNKRKKLQNQFVSHKNYKQNKQLSQANKRMKVINL